MEELFISPEFQMSLLLFVALAGYVIASQINQSAVIGLIFIGIVVGPSVLGWIQYTDFVSSLAHLGAVILLFVIGLEFKLHEIMKIKNGIIALIGVIIPWIGGYGISLLFGYSSSSAIFIGTALTATSIAITANVLQELDQLQTDAAKAIIGAAVIDDILSLLALAICNEAATGTVSAFSIGLMTVKAIAFVIIGAAAGVLVISRFIEYVDETAFAGKYPEFTFIFAMMMAYMYGILAEMVGLSAIVGAFIAGVSFNEIKLKQGHDLKEGAGYLQIIFASIFFVSLGVMVDLKAVTPEIIVFLVALTVIAVLTKLIGCGIPAYLSGMGWKESLIVGFGMAPRGEVAMIVALIGLQEGVIDQGIYVTIIIMSLITTIMTPLIYRNCFFRECKEIASSSP
ncbi:cation:proton antiporter [Methanospirillum lacunae]|uniref:Cation:proton antiporter n=1 Tax=Methanospirillum lacunae TaxID=668570 RepID=A0A2V2N913_9EURY|nr:cation:proton antiporter [Methanospirillum lacunae]PWR72081.1 cation:proton antiporter [Methanospirillum lacunae]